MISCFAPGRQPRQLRREYRHTLAPRARYAGDVGAPLPRGVVRILEPPEVPVEVPVGIGSARVAAGACGLERHNRELRGGNESREIGPGGVQPAEVVDDELAPRMSAKRSSR